VSFGAAVAGGAVAAVAGAGRAAPLIGWDILALVYGSWLWATVWKLDPESAEADARREDPSRDQADLVVLGAAIASLIAVGVVLFGASGASGNGKYLLAGLALGSVFVSWALVHTVFTLKYARLYYSGTAGGIDFNGTGAPDYPDFAYLSFTIGMTFQVSDTDIQSKAIRRTALRHAWLSFPLVAVIIATSINLVSGLAKLGVQPHMQADYRLAGRAAEFYEIADLVHEPQPMAVAGARGRPPPPGQRVGDVAAVLDLADELIPRGPDGEGAARIGVQEGVGGNLTDGEHQVEDTVPGQADTCGLAGGIGPDRGQVFPVGQGRGPVGRPAQGLIPFVGEYAPGVVSQAAPGGSARHEHGMGAHG
jgi:uncharacterized membrane protein